MLYCLFSLCALWLVCLSLSRVTTLLLIMLKTAVRRGTYCVILSNYPEVKLCLAVPIWTCLSTSQPIRESEQRNWQRDNKLICRSRHSGSQPGRLPLPFQKPDISSRSWHPLDIPEHCCQHVQLI